MNIEELNRKSGFGAQPPVQVVTVCLSSVGLKWD